ncbi:integrin alpha-PS3-like isoform X1 [Nomia melanderi]|uniref:integrin alpha-PS3-like isoform X1 n=1 Tax=Nomia melanderi TaxID=2448451 RepID=UPI003FCD7275
MNNLLVIIQLCHADNYNSGCFISCLPVFFKFHGIVILCVEEHKHKMKLIFLLFISLTCGYNVDRKFVRMYYSTDKFRNSYVGYTVYLYHDPVNNTSWLLMGAPKGNFSSSTKQPYEPGVVFRCTINDNSSCTQVKPKELKYKVGYISRLKMHMIIEQQKGWFGSSMSIDKSSGILTVCAPRTIVRLINPFSKAHFDTMQGMCYTGGITSTALSVEYDDLEFHDFRSDIWYNPMYGFSIHYASVVQDEDKRENGTHRIIGKPMHESYGSVEIVEKDKRQSVKLPLGDDVSHFGYSVESGYFFGKSQLLYASSAPGWQYVGQVTVIDVTINLSIAKLQGTSVGEFFGGSLTVGDINNDGLDDLIVGAPHWGQDNGKVYIYLGSSKGYFKEGIFLHGTVEESYFGYTVASGDLDADGFDDIIVGAPWEESGVIYIYNGGSDLKNKQQASERIQSTDIPNNFYKIERFGFSISKPVDIDGNGYLDFAVGAYKSGHVMVFRSKPVVRTRLTIRAEPNVLKRDAKEFLIEVCSQHDGYNIESIRDVEFKITIIVDERYHRTKETFLEFKSSNLTSTVCFKTQINISSNIRDFIEPISVVAKHHFVNDTSNLFCKYCPVERKNNMLNVTQIFLPFNIDCGADNICNSNISVTAKFLGIRDDNEWVIGSTYAMLNITLKNYGEPAYLTTIQFTTSKRVMLHTILPSCQEDTSKENLLVFCEVGNPLWKGEEKNIILDLDMKNLIDDSMHDYKLNFYITIKTRSTNEGMTNITKTLKLVSEVSLSLNGKSNEEIYYLNTLKDTAKNISFQQMYQVYKLGATPIGSAELIIKIPTMINLETLIDIYEPQLYVSGQQFECFSSGLFLDTKQIDLKGESSIHDATHNMQQINKLIVKRHINESDLDFDDTKKNVGTQHISENIVNNVVYMNCSNPDVYCTTIICGLNTLKTLQDVGKVLIKLVLNVEKLKDIFETNKVALKFSTEATVNILKPTVRLSNNETRSTVELVTMFYNGQRREELHLWIIITSVSVGLLLLIILAAVLFMLGFFKRQTNCCMK